MPTPEREARMETVNNVAAGLTAGGILLVALAPLAIPILALTALFAAPLLLVPLLAAPFVLLAALAIRLGRRLRAPRPPQGTPATARTGSRPLGHGRRSYGTP